MADSELVEPIANEPAVLDDVSDAQHDWICRTNDDAGRCAGPATTWFTDPSRWDVFLASTGPEGWQRVDTDDPQPEARAVDPIEVRDIRAGTDTISFEVDEPGSPVLVKASYFPNWRVSGAEGPYRVAPNLMVVVPTDRHVELHYGREPIEWFAYALTAMGIGLALVLATRPPVPVPEPRVRRRPARHLTDPLADTP